MISSMDTNDLVVSQVSARLVCYLIRILTFVLTLDFHLCSAALRD